MNSQEAKNLIIATFEKSFDESRFLIFIKNLLNNLDESKRESYRGNYIPDSFKDTVNSYKRLGQYKDDDNNVIDILTINLKRKHPLNAKTLQRNFIARHLKKKSRSCTRCILHRGI